MASPWRPLTSMATPSPRNAGQGEAALAVAPGPVVPSGVPGDDQGVFTGHAPVPPWAGALSVAAAYGCPPQASCLHGHGGRCRGRGPWIGQESRSGACIPRDWTVPGDPSLTVHGLRSAGPSPTGIQPAVGLQEGQAPLAGSTGCPGRPRGALPGDARQLVTGMGAPARWPWPQAWTVPPSPQGGPRPYRPPGHPGPEALGVLARGPLGIGVPQGARRFAQRRPRGGLAVWGPERPAWPGSPCPGFGPGQGRASRGHMPDSPLSARARERRMGQGHFRSWPRREKAAGRQSPGLLRWRGAGLAGGRAPHCPDGQRAGGLGGSIWRESLPLASSPAWFFLPLSGQREVAGAWTGRPWAFGAPGNPDPWQEPGSMPLRTPWPGTPGAWTGGQAWGK
jgi:hypothetical protein